MYALLLTFCHESQEFRRTVSYFKLWRKVKHTVPMMYASLITAMVAGRLVWGAVRFVLAGLTGSSFPFSAFLSGALLTAVPGIVAQLVLIPLILIALQKAKFID